MYVGDLVLDLYAEQCPRSSENFIKLCKLKYYNLSPVSSIKKNILCHWGNSTSEASPKGQDRSINTSYWGYDRSHQSSKFFAPEFNQKTDIFDSAGIVAFTTFPAKESHGQFYSLGDPIADSQFTISLVPDIDRTTDTTFLAPFAKVVEGLDTLEKINNSLTDVNSQPSKPILILHAHILEDPFDDISDIEFPEHSPEPSDYQLDTLAQVYADTENLEEAENDKQSQEARAQALTLELMGDLPFSEVKPSENVLFVCKLNPVTESSDLELIFSRFGPIVSCEIIKDPDTGDSLQYAFIEYEHRRDCERAYAKMEGVLIDDRRIHVDFSQSVKKLESSWRNAANAQRKKAHGSQFRTTDRHSDHYRHKRRGSDEHYRDRNSNKERESERNRERNKERDGTRRSARDRRSPRRDNTFDSDGYRESRRHHRDYERDHHYRQRDRDDGYRSRREHRH